VAVAVLRAARFRRRAGRRRDAADAELRGDAAAAVAAGRTGGPDPPGGPARETADASWEQARAWRAEGMRDAGIARAAGEPVHGAAPLGRAHPQEALPPRRSRTAEPGPGGTPGTEPQVTGPEVASRRRRPDGGSGPAAGPRPVTVSSRYAGTMLLHAFFGAGDAGPVLAAAGGGPEEVRLLTAVSMCFALGAGTAEQFKHLAAAEAGPLAGLPALPGCGLRPALAGIADRTDPLEIQSLFARGCSPPTRWSPACTTSMITSSPIPVPSGPPKGGTTSGAAPSAAARTRT